MEAKHTPTPWKISEDWKEDIVDESGELIATNYEMNSDGYNTMLSNAEFIVRAVNSHDVLVQALKEALPILEKKAGSYGHGGGYTARENYPKLFAKIEAALASAGEQP